MENTPRRLWRGPPVLGAPPSVVDSLAWYQRGEIDLSTMNYVCRYGVESCFETCHETGMVGVPRVCAPLPSRLQDATRLPPARSALEFTSAFRDGQESFVGALVAELRRSRGVIGEAPTGTGKTVCGIAVACALNTRVCVVVPKGDLNWAGEFARHTNLDESDVADWRGQTLPDPDAPVVVASLQSVYREGVYPDSVYRDFGLVIFDEVHRLGSDEFRAAARKFPARYRMGLSAQPERRDGRMALVRAHLGREVVRMEGDALAGDVFFIESDWIPPPGGDYDPSRTNRAKRSLFSDPQRNGAVANAVVRACRAGRCVIVFAEQTAHLEALWALVEPAVGAGNVLKYWGALNREQVAAAKGVRPGQAILATYKKANEGTDIPALDVAVLASPIYDPIQSIGRVRRMHPGKPRPVVVDVADRGSGVLSRLLKARLRAYRETGMEPRGEYR